MFTKFGGVIRSVIPACNCFFRELHVIKFPDASNKLCPVVSLIKAQLLEAIISIKDSVSLVILVGVRINCVKPKSCNIDLNSQLSDILKN